MLGFDTKMAQYGLPNGKWCQAKWAYIDTTTSNRGNLWKSVNELFFFGKASTPNVQTWFVGLPTH